MDSRLASGVGGAVLPTQDPFLYVISATVADGVSLKAVDQADLEQLDLLALRGITEEELAKAKRQLRARLVFENDSVTNIAHQIGFFETIANVDVYRDLPARIADVSIDQLLARRKRKTVPQAALIAIFNPDLAIWLFIFSYIFVGFLFELHRNQKQ